MGIVIPFPLAPSFTCRTVAQAEADAAQDGLAKAMGACPACAGRGWIVWSDGVEPFRERCPCGGTDEDRVDLPDFDGAA